MPGPSAVVSIEASSQRTAKSLFVIYVGKEPRFELIEGCRLERGRPLGCEAPKHVRKLVLEPSDGRGVVALPKLDEKLAAGVPDAHARAIRHGERASRGPSKRATCVRAARGAKTSRRRAGQPERRQLVVAVQVLGSCRAALPATPDRRRWIRATSARVHVPKLFRQSLAQLAQLHGELLFDRAWLLVLLL
jgi:hypothetical protein